MQKYEKFLFFYSTLTITVFVISYGIFAPKPINFLTALFAAPIAFYFWIRATNPEKSNPVYWSMRFMFFLFVLSGFGIGVYYLAMKNPPVASSSIVSVEAIATTKPTQSAIPSSNTNITNLILPKVTVVGNMDINIYQNPEVSSKVVGYLVPGINYLYSERNGSWYKVKLNDQTFGWADGNELKEIN